LPQPCKPDRGARVGVHCGGERGEPGATPTTIQGFTEPARSVGGGFLLLA
jgi:hypothetical protein